MENTEKVNKTVAVFSKKGYEIHRWSHRTYRLMVINGKEKWNIKKSNNREINSTKFRKNKNRS